MYFSLLTVKRSCILVSCAILLLLPTQIIPQDRKANLDEPAAFWEKVIAAKGGRDRLHKVKSMVESKLGVSSRNINRIETLWALPDRYWSWADQRPSLFGISVIMYDHSKDRAYSVYNGDFGGFRPIGRSNTNLAGLTVMLLETNWNKPVPQRLYETKIGNKSVMVIETILRGERGDYAIDPHTHLPLEYFSYNKHGAISDRTSFDAYRDFDGIKMPTKIVFKQPDQDFEYEASYQFNVDYDESIFSAPPRLELGREAWKPKKKSRPIGRKQGLVRSLQTEISKLSIAECGICHPIGPRYNRGRSVTPIADRILKKTTKGHRF